MSNLLFFGSGVAKGAGEFLDEKKAAYERQVEFTTRSLREELKAARLARRAKTDAATQRLEELGSLGITGAAAEAMLRLSDPLYQTHITKFMEMGAAPEGLTETQRLERLGFVGFDPSMAGQEALTNEEIINRFVGEFPAAAIRPKDEPDFRRSFAEAFGFADPEGKAREQAAKSLGISTEQAAALLDDTFERKAYESSVRLEPVITEREKIERSNLEQEQDRIQLQLAEAEANAAILNAETTEVTSIPYYQYNPETDKWDPKVRTVPVGTSQRELNFLLERAANSATLTNTLRQQEPASFNEFESWERGTIKQNILTNLSASQWWDPKIKFSVTNGLQVGDDVSRLQFSGFQITANTLQKAAARVRQDPTSFGLSANADVYAIQNYLMRQENTIAGQVSLQLFKEEMSRAGVTEEDLLGAGQNFNQYFSTRYPAVADFSQQAQDYITKMYSSTEANRTFNNNEAMMYARLTGTMPGLPGGEPGPQAAAVPGDAAPAPPEPETTPGPQIPTVADTQLTQQGLRQSLGTTLNILVNPDIFESASDPFKPGIGKDEQLQRILFAVQSPENTETYIENSEIRKYFEDMVYDLAANDDVEYITEGLLRNLIKRIRLKDTGLMTNAERIAENARVLEASRAYRKGLANPEPKAVASARANYETALSRNDTAAIFRTETALNAALEAEADKQRAIEEAKAAEQQRLGALSPEERSGPGGTLAPAQSPPQLGLGAPTPQFVIPRPLAFGPGR